MSAPRRPVRARASCPGVPCTMRATAPLDVIAAFRGKGFPTHGHRQCRGQPFHVLAPESPSISRPFEIALTAQVPTRSDPRSRSRFPGGSNRRPLPASCPSVAAIVAAFGSIAPNGRRCSSATCNISSETASETESPIAPSSAVALSLAFVSMRAHHNASLHRLLSQSAASMQPRPETGQRPFSIVPEPSRAEQARERRSRDFSPMTSPARRGGRAPMRDHGRVLAPIRPATLRRGEFVHRDASNRPRARRQGSFRPPRHRPIQPDDGLLPWCPVSTVASQPRRSRRLVATVKARTASRDRSALRSWPRSLSARGDLAVVADLAPASAISLRSFRGVRQCR